MEKKLEKIKVCFTYNAYEDNIDMMHYDMLSLTGFPKIPATPYEQI